MKARKILSILLVLVFMAGCNMPNRTPTTGPTDVPVNITLTALFKTAMAVPDTSTPAPVLPTVTHAVATSTQLVVPPTNTVAPPVNTATPVPPTAAPKTPTVVGTQLIEASRLSTVPTIDGDWSEWKKVAHEYPAQNIVYGKGNWTGEGDLNASYYVGWDANNLYLAVKVHDDRYVQLAQGENIYKGDSIELLLDTNRSGDLATHALNSDDYQIGISPGRPIIADHNPEVYLWFPTQKSGDLSNVTVGAVDEGGVYRVEAAIPWSVFGVTPAKGMRFGFAISASDNDQAGQQVQESMVSSVPTRHLTDPATWGDLVLK